jgi:hypothetical protein
VKRSKRDFGFCWGFDLPEGVEVVEELTFFPSEMLMKNRIYGASYERAVKLEAAGCPIDNLDALPRHSFRAEKLPGYAASCVYALGPLDTGYVIPLRLATDRPSGTIIRSWIFEPPWPDHVIDWEYDPEDVIPRKDQDVFKSLFKSRLMGVLNEGRKIHNGSTIDGVLCGRSFQPIGECSHGFISAKLSLTDDQGYTVQLPIDLTVYRLSYASANRHSVGGTRERLSRLLAESERRSVLARELEALNEDEQVQPQMQSGSDALLETSKPESGGRASPAGPGSESGSPGGDAATRQGS